MPRWCFTRLGIFYEMVAVCGELLILPECTVEVQTCESFAGR
jgi:hypothetical protein